MNAAVPVVCSNLKCGFTWRTISTRRAQKCYKCHSKGAIHRDTLPAECNAKVKQRKSDTKTVEQIRQEKLSALKERLEMDNDEDNFRLSTFERKSINKKIRTLESSKIYAKYVCQHCGITWTSVHGWSSFTQRCIHCGELALCLGQIELSIEQIQAKMHRSVRRMTGQSRGGAGFCHDPRRCQMCGIFIQNGHDVNCMMKKWVRLEPMGSTYRIIQSK